MGIGTVDGACAPTWDVIAGPASAIAPIRC